MRSLLLMCVVACLASVAGIASAADVPQDMLSQAGLSGMQQMTDSQGLEIRGSGFASVSGFSWTFWPNAGSYNSYTATSFTRGATAAGASLSTSLAGGLNVFGPFTSGWLSGVVSGGGAVAYAK